MFDPISDLSQNQVGRFIPTRELNEWHNKMKQMYPQVYPADDKLFGDDGEQHSYGTKLKTFFDGDITKPMVCEVVGSCWQTEFGTKEPHYLIFMDGDDEISEIPLTSAHEEGGWKIIQRGIGLDDEVEPESGKSSGHEPQHSEKNESEENNDIFKCALPTCGSSNAPKTCGRCKKRHYCNEQCQKKHWKFHKFECIPHDQVKHSVDKSASLETIQTVIRNANVNDVIILPSGTFGHEGIDFTLEIDKNLHFAGEGMNKTTLICKTLLIKQNGCGGGKAIFRNFKIQGTVEVVQNTFHELSFVSVEVDATNTPTYDAFEVNCCPGKFLAYCCEIKGGSDGLCLTDCSTRATIDQTDISYAQCRGIFSNIDFKIKDSAVYGCGSYGIKGRSGWTDMGGNNLQPGPWSEFGPY